MQKEETPLSKDNDNMNNLQIGSDKWSIFS